MIYGLLWLAYVGFLLSIRHTPPRVQVKYWALASIALAGVAWLCYITRFEPGPTSPTVTFGALGLFALLVLWSVLSVARSVMQSDEALERWPVGINFLLVFVSGFVLVVGMLGYPVGLAITGSLIILILSMVVPKRSRHV